MMMILMFLMLLMMLMLFVMLDVDRNDAGHSHGCDDHTNADYALYDGDDVGDDGDNGDDDDADANDEDDDEDVFFWFATSVVTYV